MPSLIALTGCKSADSDPGLVGVGVEHARAVDEAAEKLDAEAKRDNDTVATR